MSLSAFTALPAFSALPDGARLWLLALVHPTEAATLAPEMEALMARWRHKGVQYQGAWALLENRILAVAEPTLAAEPSGCAIDGMLRGVNQLTSRLGLAVEDPQAVLVRLEDGIHAISRTDLEERLADGTLDGATPVLDLALLTLGDLREGRLERPLAATWIGRKYKIQAPAVTGA
ncbi:hypothetical protein [Geothrix sp. PMB-07]|uniref:hypothetical protein n=1 Tax=Geothrix sp. PMB-07 TaxID=3068640 RepID=UPI0027424B5B|nr:hypothetical protein [Geothrix sp. PMB-07]WLT29958.1 hypothetical protein Q9293_09545 [Geothrix sp. PMB-07]